MPAPEPAAAPAGEGGSIAGLRVLVVEDNDVNQLVAIGLLENLGCEVDVVIDGIEAVAALTGDHGYAAVLMDCRMPRLDGYDATRRVRAAEPDGVRVPIIAMTASATEGERERCLAAGMDDFLTKPVDASALRAVLHRWMNSDGEHEPLPRGDTDTYVKETTMTDGLDVKRLDELRDLDPGETRYLDRAIGNFVANTPTTMATIREAYENGDTDTLRQVAHKLAGGALNLGVTGAGEIAQQIELVADTGSVSGAGALVDELGTALEDGRAALLAYQASYSR
jgi:CheY-like chemotaxis protein/HPt (histidine-containing phosphotransfer) domain-containing protein